MATDRAALAVLYNATDGANWTDNTNWLSTEPLSEWYGVLTNTDGRVTNLTLYGNQLSGEIPAELGNLTNLQVFDVRNTGLSCVTPGSELHTWLATINFQGSVCATRPPGGGGGGPPSEAPETYSGNGNVTLLGQFNPRAPFTSSSDHPSTEQSYMGIWGYASAGREYALLTHSQGLSITEVTDPANPVEIQFIPSAGGRIHRDIDTYLDPMSGKTYAYFGGQEGANLYSIDLSYLPVTIPASGIVDLGRTNWTHTLQVADGLLFVNSAGSSLGCQIFDAQANPANPPLLAQSWSGSDRECHDSFTRDNILYSADGYSTRWRIVDIAGIRGGSAPMLLGETAMKSGVYAHGSWLSDDSQYMYSFEEFNIEDINVFDVSDPANPVNVENIPVVRRRNRELLCPQRASKGRSAARGLLRSGVPGLRHFRPGQPGRGRHVRDLERPRRRRNI